MSQDRIQKRGGSEQPPQAEVTTTARPHQAALHHRLVQRRRNAEAERLREAVQAKAGPAPGGDAPHVHQAAAEGTAGAGARLPHLDRVQQSFGPRHDLSGVQAHLGEAASAASEKMGARAFATGNHVAFAGEPDLHTVAHETAHVVQQRAGVQLKGGVGEEGDACERHADEVADRVVAGRSAADLLEPYAGGSATPAVQHQTVQRIVEPGAEPGLRVYVTRRDGTFEEGTIVEEEPDRGGYVVDLKGGKDRFAYAELNLHDPRGADASLGAQKWREYVRGKDQGSGPTAYDNDGTDFGRKLDKGQSYGASMTAAQGTVSDSLGVPMSPGYVKHLQDQGSAHLSHAPDWRNEKSGNSGDGRIGVSLLDQHADPDGVASMRGSKTMSYGGRSGGRMMTHEGPMDSGPVLHRIATQPMTTEQVQGALTAILETYYATIQTARSKDQILDAIARFTQDLARLHPFENANTRTNMLVLNKLLAENGFPLAIVDDPKHFYLNKLESWKAKIVDGMARWTKLGGNAGADAPEKSSKPGSSRKSPGKLEAASSSSGAHRAPVDDLDIEVRPLEELFEDDEEGLDEIRAAMSELELGLIQARATAIQALQRQVIELGEMFRTYGELVARSSDSTAAVEQHLESTVDTTEHANQQLQ